MTLIYSIKVDINIYLFRLILYQCKNVLFFKSFISLSLQFLDLSSQFLILRL
jgi:hypothetical protein